MFVIFEIAAQGWGSAGGTGRTRTGNLLDAIEALSWLSYGPFRSDVLRVWWWSDGESHPDPCNANAAFSC